MDVRRLQDFAQIDREQWAALCARSGTNTIFQTYEWHLAWWEAYGEGPELYLLVVEDGPDLVGIAPMMLSHEEGGRRVLAFIGDYRSDYLDFIYDAESPAVVHTLIAYLAGRRDDWDNIRLSEIPEGSPTHLELEGAAEQSGVYCATIRRRQCPALVIKGNETEVDTIINKKKLRYYKRYFEEKPGYSVRHLAACDEIGPHLDGFFEQHITRWAETPTPSIFLEDKSKAFYRNLLSAMCDKGWITFTVIENEGITIAYHFGFVYRNVFVLYKPIYNPLLAKHSPGQVLLKELLTFAVARKYDEFDFTVGGEAYKRRFASEIRYNTTYRLLASRRDLMALGLSTGLKRLLKSNRLGRRLVILRKRLMCHSLPRLRETVRRYGVYGWIRRAAGMLFRRFIFSYDRVLYFEMPAGLVAANRIEARLKDVRFRRATLDDLINFDYPESPLLKPEFVSDWRRRLEDGDVCFITEVHGEVASMFWTRVRERTYIAEAEADIVTEDRPVFLCDSWTLPKFRGNNLLTFMMANAIEQYPDKRKIAYLYENNVAPKRAVLKLGNFTLTRVYYLLNILGMKRRWSKPYTGPQPTL
jgi:CelD/BcsL family acetyltransferase involved in cellulose biosynthesis